MSSKITAALVMISKIELYKIIESKTVEWTLTIITHKAMRLSSTTKPFSL